MRGRYIQSASPLTSNLTYSTCGILSPGQDLSWGISPTNQDITHIDCTKQENLLSSLFRSLFATQLVKEYRPPKDPKACTQRLPCIAFPLPNFLHCDVQADSRVLLHDVSSSKLNLECISGNDSFGSIS